jgi:hypothetical protein
MRQVDLGAYARIIFQTIIYRSGPVIRKREN